VKVGYALVDLLRLRGDRGRALDGVGVAAHGLILAVPPTLD
jgi:hypothetical protein